MRIGLFVPCYVDAFEPEVGIATLELLERLGCTVEYPFDQTCCGQPMTNTGCHAEAAATEAAKSTRTGATAALFHGVAAHVHDLALLRIQQDLLGQRGIAELFSRGFIIRV